MKERAQLIDDLCDLEWKMFVQVNNTGGKASCQNDEQFFKKMRMCQYDVWSNDMLVSYMADLLNADASGRNLPMEKYAWMMESTHPAEFEGIRASLPPVPQENLAIIAEIVAAQVEWEAEVDKAYPYMRAGGRPLRKSQDSEWVTSFETYMEGELKTFSTATLQAYKEHVQAMQKEGLNFALIVAENTAKAYGFESLAAADDHARRSRMQGM